MAVFKSADKIALHFSRCVNRDETGGRWMVQTLPLIVNEEEQFIFDDRSPERASEHVPAHRRGGNWRRVGVDLIFPLVGIQNVIPEKLPDVAMKSVGAGFDGSALTMPPMKFPNSAGALLLMRLNSWIASGEGVKPRRLSDTSLLSKPSRRKLLDCSRLPLINGRSQLFTLSPLLKLLASGWIAPGENSVSST